MRSQGGGRIVNFADWVAASGRPRYRGYLPYFVAKRGVIALTEALALELAADQILVNCIAPGPIVAPPGTTDEELKAVEQATPVGRWGGEEEIAKAAMFLVESDFVTGETVLVTGAGGSIGSELCRQLAALGADALILVDHSESMLVDIERWRDAPLWDPDLIAEATKTWFRYLGKQSA